ncbi:hypothetical protein [Endozoicomonas ascidiicola]|uniref:hypothetical protein n=1 Tax=Endozoicomonas ascidiicola TaxID=1698521 RepID=UPI00082AA9B0|nr:hypothetical protein [Endozoicomonas ascidiicola]
MEITLFRAVFAFALSFALIRLLKPISRKLHLVDIPNERKHHENAVPLIGGLVIYLTLISVEMLFFTATMNLSPYYISAGFLTFVGVLDDRYDLSVKARVACTFLATGLMMYWGGQMFTNLGDLIGVGDIVLPVFLAVPFTLIACFGIINATNMMDGIDGLSSGLCVLSLTSILIALNFQTELLEVILCFIGAILAFQIYNLQLHHRFQKVFLGDAGSMLLGFTLIMMICYYSQSTATRGPRFEAVTGLFLVGLPLIDMIATVFRRVHKGKNPFKPDRTHAHHIFMHAGFNQKQTLLILLLISALINGIGILLHYSGSPAWLQFIIFFVVFITYYKGIKHSFRLSHYLQKVRGKRAETGAVSQPNNH